MANLRYINEEAIIPSITPSQLDQMLLGGWRHFGERFFRYNLAMHKEEIRLVFPLRVRLSDFRFSKSQRRSLSRNIDLRTELRPISVTNETEELFDRHKQRFDHGTPESIYEFISRNPAEVPSEGKEVAVYDGDRLVASSFFDVGETSISSVYGIFEPDERARGLGIYTMLCEIQYALDHGKEFYYHGYAYNGESFYDYKKRFSALEVFDWGEEQWRGYDGKW